MTDLPQDEAALGVGITTRALQNVPRGLRGMLALEDFERAAARRLPRSVHGYVAGAVETGHSFAANRRAFADLAFVPRVLRDTAGRTQRRTLLGRAYARPFGIAPMGFSALAAYDGDVALARAARAEDILSVCSATSLTRLERVAAEGGGGWFQAYLAGHEGRIAAMLDRVSAAGFDTIVVTADVPVAGNRENNARNGFDAPFRPSLRLAWQGMTHPHWLFGTALRTVWRHGMPHFENMDATRGPPILSKNLIRSMGDRDRLAWRHIELIRRRWPGKLVVKGIVAPEDARIARETGVDGIVVSNHGGRQLDGTVAPLLALRPVRREAGEMAVILDSGVRRGTDVLKALALGADFVLVGRPFLCAAAIAGEAGARHAIRLLAAEIDRNMAMLGLADLDGLDASYLCRSLDGAPVEP